MTSTAAVLESKNRIRRGNRGTGLTKKDNLNQQHKHLLLNWALMVRHVQIHRGMVSAQIGGDPVALFRLNHTFLLTVRTGFNLTGIIEKIAKNNIHEPF